MTSKFDRKEFRLGGTEEFVREGGSEAMGCVDCSSLSAPLLNGTSAQAPTNAIEWTGNTMTHNATNTLDIDVPECFKTETKQIA